MSEDDVVADLAEMIIEAEENDLRRMVEDVRADFIDTVSIGITAITMAFESLVEAMPRLAELAAEVEHYEDQMLAELEDDFWSGPRESQSD